MLSFPVVKATAQIIGGLGVSKVVSQVIQNNTTIVTLTDAVLVRVGSLVIGSIAIDHATAHIGDIFDSIVNNVEVRRTGQGETADGA